MSTNVKKLTSAEQLNQDIMTKLSELGGKAAGEDEITFGYSVVIPELYRDDIGGFIEMMIRYKDAQEEPNRFQKTYPYKPWDGAVAVQRAFKKHLGFSGYQKNSFFEQAGYQVIPVSPSEEMTVPYGKITIPTFKGTLRIEGTPDEEGYLVFTLVVDAPKKYQYHVEGIFKIVEEELKNFSIYRGKAVDGSEMPKFLDLSSIDINKIIYAQETFRQLEANLWVPIMYPEVARAQGIDPKRAILLEGQYGTGKTLAAMWTAKKCEQRGRTFIMCNPKDNNTFECLKTAALYQPSCVFIEDIDRMAETSDKDNMARLLDEFDGFKAKNKDIMIILTTNKVGQIHKGMLRPGRMDAVIQLRALDLPGTERLIRSQFDPKQIKGLNYAEIHAAMKDFTPSFMKEVCQKVILYSVKRIAEGMAPHYTTQDFLDASAEMRVHYDLHSGANELVETPSLDRALMSTITEVLDKSIIVDRRDEDPMYRLEVTNKDKGN